MLNFRNASIGLLIVLAVMAILYILLRFSLVLFIIPLGIYLVLMFYGSFFVCSQFYMKVICNVKTDRKIISLTFDDGPVKEITPGILDTLGNNDIRGTFFCVGRRIGGNEEIIRRMDTEGHLIGNHSWTHSPWIDFYSERRLVNEFMQTEEAIRRITGKKIRLFRPPVGITNPAIRNATKKCGYTAVGWNIRSLDTTIRDPEKIIQRILKRLQPGSIVLFHDVHPEIAVTLARFVKIAGEKGYEFVRLDELLQIDGYS